MKLRITAAAMLAVAISATALSPGPSVLGDWREEGGSVIRVASCGPDVCATLIAISRQAPAQVDALNPNPASRTRPLCGLVIGSGFHLVDSSHAEDGKLYDPKSGKTYKGSMVAEGDQLHLRGYVGIKAFGRTAVWSRVASGSGSCSK